jgi:Xaa-Pro aminopeptidase
MKTNAFNRRIKACLTILKSSVNQSALLLSSHPPVIRSHDTHYPYKQQSDFYYLTGSEIQNSALLISSKLKHPILFAPPQDAHKTLWEGKQPNPKILAQQIGAELKVAKDMRAEVLAALRGHDQLLFQNIPGSLSFKITSELIAIPSYARGNLPSQFSHSDVLLERLRLFKDAEEVETIRAANEITSEALLFVAAKIQPGQFEYEVARTLEYIFGMNKCSPAFNSIIAAGKNAATLHYEALNSRIGKNDMVLIDSGAQLDNYCADITRMLPASGQLSPIHK